MSSKNISYKLDNEVYKVRYLKNIKNSLTQDIKSLNSDQKILFIYDRNIRKEFIDNRSKVKTINVYFLFFDNTNSAKSRR